MNDFDAALCPRYHRAVEIIGRRWSGSILRVMLAGATRFSEIKHAIPEVSDRMLSERLKELEAEGLVTRNVRTTTPVKVEYHLTPMGESLGPVLDGIGRWATSWLELPEASAAAEQQRPQEQQEQRHPR